MQEFGYIPKLGVKPKQFWKMALDLAKAQNADPILCYMFLMVREAGMHNGVELTRTSFQKHGRDIDFFPGVLTWFARMNRFAKSKGVKLEHYIISSGIKEMIEGCRIGKEFKTIYASSFIYDQNGIARWPSMAVNYTTKTQFLFRINKGCLDVWDTAGINAYQAMEKRPIPFNRIIFIGDGETDVPCMSLVKNLGGYSCAVHKSGAIAKRKANLLLEEGRVNLISPADYTSGSLLEREVRKAIATSLSGSQV